jgi:N-acyl-D-aspartate/D-glutamate deacylase
VNISHIKALGIDVHGQAPAIIALVRAAIAEGLIVTADQYPWTASSTGLSAALLPRWAEAGGRDSLLARLADSVLRSRIEAEMDDNLRRRGGSASLLLTGVSGPDSMATGSTLEGFAVREHLGPIEAALRILEHGSARVASFNMIDEDIETLMREPFVMTSSDGSGGHPRLYGSHARKLRHYVLDRPVISMERMIAASTAQVAEAFGLVDRGCLAPGCFADVIVFDPATVRENATYLEPALPATGMRWVFVNGVAVVNDGTMTGALPGRGLARRVR